ncbi:hypothetical protein AVEN_231778-1 [Araneus ventricosus]|uniref:Uncharacterized protein n=1 Tax=Araneus ventricosus TaxID=182803 RepID=A0A4Y2NFM2_ARAVE|nr:hypothetical protein AVEN_231778-1 [Araneus ventricosus]
MSPVQIRDYSNPGYYTPTRQLSLRLHRNNHLIGRNMLDDPRLARFLVCSFPKATMRKSPSTISWLPYFANGYCIETVITKHATNETCFDMSDQ